MNKIKNRIKKLKETVLKYCNKIPISNKILGTWIRSYHYTLPTYITMIILFGPKWLIMICYIFLLLVIILFYYYKGCWLSIIEKELCKDNSNISDWLVELCGYEINRKNRYDVTYKYFIWYILIILIITYFRFIK